VYDTQLSNVLNARYNLLEECAGCHFINLLVLHDVVEEFAAGGELHDKVQFLRCLDDLVKLNDVGVLDDLKDVDFARNTLNISNVNNFTLFEYFDGHLLIGYDVAAKFDLSKCAFTNRLAQDVLPYLALIRSQFNVGCLIVTDNANCIRITDRLVNGRCRRLGLTLSGKSMLSYNGLTALQEIDEIACWSLHRLLLLDA